tara:strand:+ start:620 stop:775 length:156 start_codon:yes stop_codon:yes gene_type:complete
LSCEDVGEKKRLILEIILAYSCEEITYHNFAHATTVAAQYTVPQPHSGIHP